MILSLRVAAIASVMAVASSSVIAHDHWNYFAPTALALSACPCPCTRARAREKLLGFFRLARLGTAVRSPSLRTKSALYWGQVGGPHHRFLPALRLSVDG